MKSFSTKTQILILTLALATVSVGFLVILTIIQINNQLHDDIEQRAISLVSVMATNIGPGIEFEDEIYIRDIISGAFEDKDIIGICVCGENDEQIYFQSKDDNFGNFEVICPATDTLIIDHKDDVVIVLKPIKFKDKLIGDIWIAMSEKDTINRIKSSVGYLLGFSVLVLLIVFVAGNIIASKIVNPIKNFEIAANRIQKGNMVTPIDLAPLNKDFIPLGLAFNKMSTGIDLAFDELKASRQNLEAQVEIRTSELRKELGERRKAEDALKQSQQKLELHIKQTPLGVIQWDLDFKVVEWNKAAEKIFGYSSDEAIGRYPCGFITTEEIKELIDDIWKNLVARKGGTRSTNENITKTGETIICEWYNTPLIDDYGKTIGVASLVMDATERYRAEEQKRLRLERVQNQRVAIGRLLSDIDVVEGDFKSAVKVIVSVAATALDVERVSIWMFDDEKTQMECIDLFELSKNEHTHGTILKVSDHPNYFEAIKNERIIASHDAQTDSRTSEFTESYLKPLGINSMLDTSFYVSGKLLGVVCVEHTGKQRDWKDDEIAFIDEISGQLSQVYSNSERRRIEKQKEDLKEELERAQRMESLGILAGGVAHDLNNMLGPLVGYPELILMKLPEESPIRKQVERIGRSAKDAADVIQDLLTLARRGRYEMEPTNLVEVVQFYLDSPSYQKLSEQRPEIKLTCDFSDNKLFINGSPPHLSKVIMNLIVNATDAMPASGNLDIMISKESIDRLYGGYSKIESGNYIILRVRDTGTGIDAEDMDKIFEPYYSKKKMGSSGSGLGLSVVYGIVKDHHGYYDIISTKGEGTEFILYFPAIVEPIKAEAVENKKIGGQETILIVDDAPEQRDIATEFLNNLGYKVETVENGHEAVDYLSANKVDLILLDMIMEKDFDGLDTYREILKIHPGQKAIIVSGFSATDRVDEMLSLGAGAYVKKPFTFSTLSKVIRDELDRKLNVATPAT